VPPQVADIFCNVCNTNLGWMYVMAFEEGQKYKVRGYWRPTAVHGQRREAPFDNTTIARTDVPLLTTPCLN
jgi:hypothetical protein